MCGRSLGWTDRGKNRGQAAGSQMLTVVPTLTVLSMRNWPRWRLTMCLTIASPGPVSAKLSTTPSRADQRAPGRFGTHKSAWLRFQSG
jgi:hypothetical protein